jgi:predicted ATPase
VSTQSTLVIVLSAIDEICLKISRSARNLAAICDNLTLEFGPNIQFITSILPSAHMLFSSSASTPVSSNQGSVNFSSLCYTIQRFVSVLLQSRGPPIVLFIDDLQWADIMSFGLFHAILSGADESESFLFIASCRNNENVQLIADFKEMISPLNARLTTIAIDAGISENDVNMMIADTLGIVPRLTSTLSSIGEKV